MTTSGEGRDLVFLPTKPLLEDTDKDYIMQTQLATQPIDYSQEVAKLVAKMPTSQAAQVYDFVCFLQTRPVHTAFVEHQHDDDDDDWLNDTEEQMQAEEALWDAAYTRHHNQFDALAEAALAEISAGTTQPMFDEQGEFIW